MNAEQKAIAELPERAHEHWSRVDLIVQNHHLHTEVLWLTAQVRHLRIGLLVLTVSLVIAVFR